MRVFITGGTGLVGSRLVGRLREREDEAIVLTRRPAEARLMFGASCQIVEGDPTERGAWVDTAATCDTVVNLAGENLFARRWNSEFKERLRDSRLRATENVVHALGLKPGQAKILVNASAIGYYGPRGDEELDEQSPAGDDFLAQLCADWEAAARRAEAHGARVALVRIGIVLDKDGGALPKMLTPFRFGVGGPVGWFPWSGKQVMSWIHVDDLVGVICLALSHPGASGPLNGTAPHPVTNKQFGNALGRALHRPALLPTPPLALRVILGEVATLVTTGQRVLPRKALALGYTFRFPTLNAALTNILA
jgi:uncharacterized protein (TIGR01777 family)